MYPINPPLIQTNKVNIFNSIGKQIINGVGKINQDSILPPITAIINNPNIPRIITHLSSFKGCRELELKSPVIE